MDDKDLDPKEIVRRGYDAISYVYRADEEDASSQQYHGWLDELLPLIPAGAERQPILDLGCGCGIPVARRLAQAYRVTGVDLSPVQIERAQKLVPAAQFICQDMTTLTFAPQSFAVVVSFYAIIHVPLAEQPALLQKIAAWLAPGGLFMATLGSGDWTGTEDNWLDGGATMYWSHTGEANYRAWLESAGFKIRWTRFIPEGAGGHTLFLAEKK